MAEIGGFWRRILLNFVNSGNPVSSSKQKEGASIFSHSSFEFPVQGLVGTFGRSRVDFDELTRNVVCNQRVDGLLSLDVTSWGRVGSTGSILRLRTRTLQRVGFVLSFFSKTSLAIC